MTVRAAGNDPPAIVAPTRLEFQITDTKLRVPVITFSKENDKKPLEQLKPGFKRTVEWNKYRSQMTIQPQNKNLNYWYLFCHLKELKKMLKKIIEILFHIIMYQTSK